MSLSPYGLLWTGPSLVPVRDTGTYEMVGEQVIGRQLEALETTAISAIFPLARRDQVGQLEQAAYYGYLLEQRGYYRLYRVTAVTVQTLTGASITFGGISYNGITQGAAWAVGPYLGPPPLVLNPAQPTIDLHLPCSVWGSDGTTSPPNQFFAIPEIGVVTLTLPYQHADGRDTPIEYAVAAVDAQGSPGGILVASTVWGELVDDGLLERWAMLPPLDNSGNPVQTDGVERYPL